MDSNMYTDFTKLDLSAMQGEDELQKLASDIPKWLEAIRTYLNTFVNLSPPKRGPKETQKRFILRVQFEVEYLARTSFQHFEDVFPTTQASLLPLQNLKQGHKTLDDHRKEYTESFKETQEELEKAKLAAEVNDPFRQGCRVPNQTSRTLLIELSAQHKLSTISIPEWEKFTPTEQSSESVVAECVKDCKSELEKKMQEMFKDLNLPKNTKKTIGPNTVFICFCCGITGESSPRSRVSQIQRYLEGIRETQVPSDSIARTTMIDDQGNTRDNAVLPGSKLSGHLGQAYNRHSRPISACGMCKSVRGYTELLPNDSNETFEWSDCAEFPASHRCMLKSGGYDEDMDDSIILHRIILHRLKGWIGPSE